MSTPASTPFPPPDEVRIRALLKSLAGGILVPMEFAEHVYRIGNEACHRSMNFPATSQALEPLNLSAVEKITIQKALARCKGDKLAAARVLGIGKTTLYRKIAIYQLQPYYKRTCPFCGRQSNPVRLCSRSAQQ